MNICFLITTLLFGISIFIIYRVFATKFKRLKEHHKIRVNELKEEEQKFRIFLKNIPAISCSTDLNSKILFIEGCVEELTGFSKEDFLRGCILWESIIIPEDIEKCKYITKQLYSVPNSYFEYSFRIRTKNGQLKWLQRVAENVTDEHKNILYVHGITYDITKIKRNEEKIKELYYMHELTLNSVAEGIIVTDLKGNITNINNSAVKMLKLNGINILGKNLHDLVHGDKIDKEKCYILNAIKEGRNEKITSDSFCRVDGTDIDVECHITPLMNRGVLRGGVICFSDIGERKAFERELYQLLSVMNQAEFSVVITDLDGNILYVNRGFEKITGYTFAEVSGKNPRIFKSGEHDYKFYENLWNTITSGKTWHGKLINKRKDGSFFHEDAVIFPLVDLDGKIVNYAGIKKDITREIELEEQLKLTQKLEAMGQMVGGVAHDFNNILTIMNGYTELMLIKMDEGNEFYKPVKEIQNAVASASSLVRQLLTFSRKQVITPKPLDINVIIKNLEKMLKRLVPENIEIKIKYKEDISFVFADATQMEQIVFNLVINAKDAITEKKEDGAKVIMVETDEVEVDNKDPRIKGFNVKSGRFIKLSVSDTGIGIKKSILNRIFEPFFTTKEVGKGTGLGLATIYGIVTQNKGFINIESKPGKGSLFEIFLPCYESFYIENLNNGRIKRDNAKYNETILFVEDDKEILRIMEQGLKSLGYRIFVAENGKDGFEVFRKNRENIDIIISDVVMPEADGFQMLDEINKISDNYKIIFTTGYMDKDISDMKKSRNISFLNKPYKLSELNEKIRTLLDSN